MQSNVPSFSARSGPFTVAQLAAELGGEVEGDGGRVLIDVRPLSQAEAEHLSFVAQSRLAKQLDDCGAGAVLLDRKTDSRGLTAIRVDDPYSAFARAASLFHPQPWPEPGIDERAHVDPSATADGATVEAFAWIGPGAVVGAGSWIEPGAYVGAGVRLGERCRLMPNSVVYSGAELGDRVWLNPGAVVGSEGFGFAPRADGHVKIPQIARALIESDVELGANTCVDRGALDDTVIRRGAKLDNFVQVAHGSEIGEGSLMSAYAAVAGSSRIGRGVMMAGKAGAINGVTVGDGATFSPQSVALSDQPAGAQLAGTPAMDRRVWLRSSSAFQKLPDLLKRLRQLEKRVAELELEGSSAGDEG